MPAGKQHLGKQVSQDLGLEAPEHEGGQDLVEPASHQQALLLRQLGTGLAPAARPPCCWALAAPQPGLELLVRGKDVGHQQVQQAPQLLQAILQRRAWPQLWMSKVLEKQSAGHGLSHQLNQMSRDVPLMCDCMPAMPCRSLIHCCAVAVVMYADCTARLFFAWQSWICHALCTHPV